MSFIKIIAYFFFLCVVVSCNNDNIRVVKKYRENGTIELELQMLGDKPHGWGKQYYPNGNILEESYFKNGKLHGKTVVYHENGNVKILHYYKDGKLDGKELLFLENGKKIAEFQKKNGKTISGGSFYESGKPFSVVSEHKSISYYEDGKLLLIVCSDNNNKTIGLIKFNQDGKIAEFKGKLSCLSKSDSARLDSRNPEWKTMK